MHSLKEKKNLEDLKSNTNLFHSRISHREKHTASLKAVFKHLSQFFCLLLLLTEKQHVQAICTAAVSVLQIKIIQLVFQILQFMLKSKNGLLLNVIITFSFDATIDLLHIYCKYII